MVRVGSHSLELVDASTLLPLIEHSHNGETWVKGTAGQEYLIRITSHEPGTYTTASRIQVDGSDIGYTFQQGPYINLTANLGPMNRRATNTALAGAAVPCDAFCFSSPHGSGDDSPIHQGCISVTWSEAHDSSRPSARYFVESWQEQQNASAPDAKKEGVGALKSARGSSDVNVALANTSWDLGRQLYEIRIKYCEEAGLVARGIIQPRTVTGNEVTARDKKARKKKRNREPDSPTSSSDVVDLTQSIKEEGLPKSKKPCGPDNVVVID
jgi:hypothetical protein